jgi:hypothetical protein
MATTSTSTLTASSPLSNDPVVQSLLADPSVAKIEQYVASGLAVAGFVAGGLHPGFSLPAVTSATIGAVSVVIFGGINAFAWLQNRLHKKTIVEQTVAARYATGSLPVDRTL